MDLEHLSPEAKQALSRIQERNDRRRVGILRGKEFDEWAEFLDRKRMEKVNRVGHE